MEPCTPSPGPAGAAPWQRAWLDSFPCDTAGSLPYPRVPVSALLETAARRFPGHTACTLYGKPTAYAALDEQARRFAAGLAAMGAGPGRFVGILLPNSPEYLVALQGAWLTGATVLQLSPLMVAEELKKWIERTDCHLLVT